MLADQNLHQAVSDQLMQSEQFLVGFKNCIRVSWVRGRPTGFQGFRGFMNNRI